MNLCKGREHVIKAQWEYSCWMLRNYRMASLLYSDLNTGKEVRKSNEWLFASCVSIFLYREKKIGGECWDEISLEFNFLMSANILTFRKSFKR